MKRAELEQRVLSLWVSTQVPLTAVHLSLYTGLPRKKLVRILDELVADQILEVDSDDVGELVWTVPGASRAPGGLTRLEDVQRLEQLRGEVAAPSRARRPQALAAAPGLSMSHHGEKKSVLASGVLSFFLGPLGWLYAAPLKEAAPAIAIFLLAMTLLPGFLLTALLGIALPLSALAGVAYAFTHNALGGRSSLKQASRVVGKRGLLGPSSED